MNRHREKESLTDMTWFHRIDQWLRKAVWLLFILLIMVQAAMQSPAIRSWLTSVDRLEGVSFEEIQGS